MSGPVGAGREPARYAGPEPARYAGREPARYAGRAYVRHDPLAAPPPAEPAVLLLHGLAGDSGQPWALLPDGTGFPRIAPDLRAHGQTSHIGPAFAFTFDGLADDVAAVLGMLGVRQPVLAVGISMGADVAVNLALRWPDRIAALALIRPSWLDQPMPAHLAAFPQIAALLRAAGPEGGLARFERTPAYEAVLARSAAGAASLRSQFAAPDAVARAVRLDRMPRSVPYPDLTGLRDVPQAGPGHRRPRRSGAPDGGRRGHRGGAARRDLAAGGATGRGPGRPAGSDQRGADRFPARPRGARLRGAGLRGAGLRGAGLRGGRFRGGRFRGAGPQARR